MTQAGEQDAWSSDEECEPAEQKKRHKLYAQAWAEYREVFNAGDLWSPRPPGNYRLTAHVSLEPPSYATLKTRAVRALAKLQLRSLPCHPSRGKWHKDGPCLDWHLLGVGLQSVVPGLLMQTNAGFRILATLEEETDNLVRKVEQEIDWYQLKGVLFRRYSGYLAQPLCLPTTTICCIAMEPDRFMTSWFERRASVKRRCLGQRLRRQPPLCDVCWAPAAPAVRCCQYYSYLLSGNAPRLIMLWGRGFDDWWSWCEARPRELDMFCRTVLAAASEMRTRHIEEDMSSPWAVAGLVDRRRTMADKQLLAQTLVTLPREQVDHWFLAVLLKDIVGYDSELFFFRDGARLYLGVGVECAALGGPG